MWMKSCQNSSLVSGLYEAVPQDAEIPSLKQWNTEILSLHLLFFFLKKEKKTTVLLFSKSVTAQLSATCFSSTQSFGRYNGSDILASHSLANVSHSRDPGLFWQGHWTWYLVPWIQVKVVLDPCTSGPTCRRLLGSWKSKKSRGFPACPGKNSR